MIHHAVLCAGVALLFASTARAAHPSTVFDSAGLTRLRSVRADAAYVPIVTAMRASMDARSGVPLSPKDFDDIRAYADAVAAFAMAAAILDQSPYYTLAVSSLLGMPGFNTGDDLEAAHLLSGAAVAYDVLFSRLSATDQARVRTAIATEAQREVDEVAADIWWATDYLQNHNQIQMGAIGVAAIALTGEDSRSTNWLAIARDDFTKLEAVFDLVPDGSWHEGIGYQGYAWSTSLPFLLATARAGVPLHDTKNLQAFARYLLAVQLPELPRTELATHGDWSGWPGWGTVPMLRFAAANYRDGLATEAVNRWLSGGTRSTRPEEIFDEVLEYIVMDPTVSPVSTTTLPLDALETDQQLAVMRSGWGTGSFVLGLKNGVLGGRGNYDRVKAGGFPGGDINAGHDHMDDFGLWLYGDGQWLLPECVGYNEGTKSPPPAAWQTIFHNSMLFDGTGQLGDNRISDMASENPWFFQRDARPPVLRSTDHYAFARADGAGLYPSTDNIQSLTRTVVLARDDGRTVLRDVVQLSSAHQPAQVFHFLDAATQEGAWIRGSSKNDRVLGVRVVSPSSFQAAISNQTADNLAKEFEPDGRESLVQLRTPSSVMSVTFLDLLLPTRGTNWTSRPNVQPLSATVPEAGLTCPVPNGDSERWIFGNGGSVSAGTLALTGDSGLVRTTGSGALSRLALYGVGTLADQSGARTLVSSPNDGFVEVVYDGSTARVSGTGAVGVRFLANGVTSVVLNGQTAATHAAGSLLVIDGLATTGPTLSSASPNAAAPGMSLNVTLTGSGLSTLASCSFGAGITATCTPVSATQATAAITIASSAALGPRTISVTLSNSATATLTNGFTVIAPPTLSSVAPSSGAPGQSFNVVLTGTALSTLTSCSFGAGITASCTATSATQASAALSIATSATLGSRTVTVTTLGGTSSLTGGFSVIAPSNQPPQLLGVSPSIGAPGQNLTVILTGTALDTLTSCSFGAGITASCTATGATQATGTLSISTSAATGPRAVSVTTTGGTSTLSGAFLVGTGTQVLYRDTFTGDAVSLGPNWSATGNWYIRSDHARAEVAQGTAIATATPPSDQTVQVRLSLSAGATGSGVIARLSGGAWYAAVLQSSGRVDLTRTVGGVTTTLASVARTIQNETFYTLRLSVSGQSTVQLTVSVDGAVVLTASDSTASRLAGGKAGLLSGTLARTYYDDFLLQTP